MRGHLGVRGLKRLPYGFIGAALFAGSSTSLEGCGSTDDTGGTGGCSAGETRCAGVCVDLSSHETHCGACLQACRAEQTCVQGECVPMPSECAMGLTQCPPACVDLSSDPANCGACGSTCTAGRACVMAKCQCRPGAISCGDSCADIVTDSENCGGCGIACAADRVCSGARCVCEPGKVACGASCADITRDASNCGLCGAACSFGQWCEAGRCVGGGATGPDGCTDLAGGITLSQIAVYQSVSIPIMRSGAEVELGARNADVVTGRDALFRVFVSVDSGFSPRMLSARVFVRNGVGSDMYFAKSTIAATSQEAVLGSTFQVLVPKSKVTPETRYALEVVECGAPSGVVRSPRFPTTADSPLNARETGGLKIKLIPLLANSYVPDTSEPALARYRAMMMAMYPITSLEFSVHAPLAVEDPQDFNGMLDEVRNQRQLDKPPSDVYYYGLLKPTATLEELCANGCTAGVGFVPQGTPSQQASQRAALGLGFADAASAETMAHEVGHNHGRDHAPCPQSGIGGVDANYPYPGAATGVYGWDFRVDALMPPTSTDIMSYCSRKWISDYTYQGLVDRVAFVNGASASEIGDADVQPLLVLLVDSRGVRWGKPRADPSLPAGNPELADLLDQFGRVSGTVTVYRNFVTDVRAESIQVPNSAAGARGLRLRDGTELLFP